MSRNSLSIVVTSIIFTIFFSTSCKSTQFSRFDCNVAFEIELLFQKASQLKRSVSTIFINRSQNPSMSRVYQEYIFRSHTTVIS